MFPVQIWCMHTLQSASGHVCSWTQVEPLLNAIFTRSICAFMYVKMCFFWFHVCFAMKPYYTAPRKKKATLKKYITERKWKAVVVCSIHIPGNMKIISVIHYFAHYRTFWEQAWPFSTLSQYTMLKTKVRAPGFFHPIPQKLLLKKELSACFIKWKSNIIRANLTCSSFLLYLCLYTFSRENIILFLSSADICVHSVFTSLHFHQKGIQSTCSSNMQLPTVIMCLLSHDSLLSLSRNRWGMVAQKNCGYILLTSFLFHQVKHNATKASELVLHFLVASKPSSLAHYHLYRSIQSQEKKSPSLGKYALIVCHLSSSFVDVGSACGLAKKIWYLLHSTQNQFGTRFWLLQWPWNCSSI